MRRKKVRQTEGSKEQENRGQQQAFATGSDAGNPSAMEGASIRLGQEWCDAFNSLAWSRGLSLPQSFVNYVVTREVKDITVLQLPVQAQDEVVGEALNSAFAAYLALLARAMELVRVEMPRAADTSALLPMMLAHALYEAVEECEGALYRPPLHTDVFADAVWPATKRRLLSWLEASGADYFYRRLQAKASSHPLGRAV